MRIESIVFILALASVAQAVNPLDNDAGSGSDAGDWRTAASPIDLGTYEGQLLPPVDLFDFYRFSLPMPKVLEIAVDAEVQIVILDGDGDTYEVAIGPGSFLTFLDAKGEWYLQLTPNELVQTPYRFSIKSQPGYYIHHFRGPAPHWIAELVVGKSEEIFVTRTVTNGESLTETSSGTVTYEYSLETNNQAIQGTGHTHLATTAYGDRVRVSPSPYALPEGSVDLSVHTDTASSMAVSRSSFVNVTGWLRFIGVQMPQAKSELRWTVLSKGALRTVEGPGDSVIAWETNNLEGPAVLTPAASIAAPSTFTLEIREGESFTAVFDTWLTDGTITCPSGATILLPRLIGIRFFHNPAPGRWQLSINASVGAGGFSQYPFFVGAPFTSLGLVPPMTDVSSPNC